MRHKVTLAAIACLLILVAISGGLFAQRGPGRGQGRGLGGPGFGRGRLDPTFQTDHEVFQFLLDNGKKIRRNVTNLPNGIETLTESDDPQITAKIQEHVAAMYDRLEEKRPIHMRDPLFRELFQHAAKIEMKLEDTEKGVRVVETSADPYVAKLLQEHAKVVSLFIKNGRVELPKNHALPDESGAADRDERATAGCCQTGCRAEKSCPKNCQAGTDKAGADQVGNGDGELCSACCRDGCVPNQEE